MKTIILPLLALSGAFAFASPAVAKNFTERLDEPRTLQLKIELPPSADLFYERDVAELLAHQVSETFLRRGYDGRVDDVFYPDDVRGDRPVLAINLIRWQRNRAGFVDCTFTAEIRRTDGSVERLGIFTGSSITFGPRIWDLRDAFEGAARNASDQLWSTLVKRDLLPAVAA